MQKHSTHKSRKSCWQLSLPASSFTSTSTVARSSSRVITSHWKQCSRNQLHRPCLLCSACFFVCSSTTSQSSTLRANKCTSQTRCLAFTCAKNLRRGWKEIAEDTVISISTVIADAPVRYSRIENREDPARVHSWRTNRTSWIPTQRFSRRQLQAIRQLTSVSCSIWAGRPNLAQQPYCHSIWFAKRHPVSHPWRPSGDGQVQGTCALSSALAGHKQRHRKHRRKMPDVQYVPKQTSCWATDATSDSGQAISESWRRRIHNPR